MKRKPGSIWLPSTIYQNYKTARGGAVGRHGVGSLRTCAPRAWISPPRLHAMRPIYGATRGKGAAAICNARQGCCKRARSHASLRHHDIHSAAGVLVLCALWGDPFLCFPHAQGGTFGRLGERAYLLARVVRRISLAMAMQVCSIWTRSGCVRFGHELYGGSGRWYTRSNESRSHWQRRKMLGRFKHTARSLFCTCGFAGRQ